MIIAEVGSNFNSLQDCLDSIAMAKACGADAVKFQYFTKQDLYGPMADTTESLPREWLTKLKQKADDCKINFMCTAFSPEGAAIVNEFVDIHKVASAELTHMPLLQRLAMFNKPVILSTGAHATEDIGMALTILNRPDTTLLHCVAAYPACDANLERIEALRTTFPGFRVGFSDHTTDYSTIPVMAMRHYGAAVLEKHFKLRDMDTPDNPHSIKPDQFKLMVKYIKEGRKAELGWSSEENEMIFKHNRRLKIISDMKLGDALKFGKNFGCYRFEKPAINAMSSWMAPQLEGKYVSRDLKAGDELSQFDVEGVTI